MQKTKIIKEIIGKRIEPYGFHFQETDGTTRIFVREVKGIKRYYDPEIDVVNQYIKIVKHAFAMLDEMSAEEEAIPTKKMNERLLHHSRQLDQNLTDKYHIKTVPEKIEDIDEWERLIRQLLAESIRHPYEEEKELLMEIAAFIGNRSCELCASEWYSFDYLVYPRIRNFYRVFSPLDLVVNIWRAKCDKEAWGVFDDIIAEFKQGLLKQPQ